jgi:cardiolipin synthase (CMP-forming)
MKKFSFYLLKNLPAHEKKITVSTYLTLVRFTLIPLIVISMIMQAWHIAFMLFIIAGITDVLDGWLARLLNQRTFLGAALDTLTDKILTIAVFATLSFAQSPLFTIPHWFVLLVLFKELVQVTGAFYIYRCKGHLTIAPTRLGKSFGLVQTAFVSWLFTCYFFHWVPIKTYFVMLTAITLLVILTFVDYLRIGFAQVRA